MKTMRKLLAAAFCACSSFSMMFTPVSAAMLQQESEEIVFETTFQKSRVSDQPAQPAADLEMDSAEEVESVQNPAEETAVSAPVENTPVFEAEEETAVPEGTVEETAAAVQEEEMPEVMAEDTKEEENTEGEIEAELPEEEKESVEESKEETEKAEAVSLLDPKGEALETTFEKIGAARLFKDAQEESNPYQLEIVLEPDFENLEIWQNEASPYHKARLWGQCTWFSWHRFYEIYGFVPGFNGNGYQVAQQLVNAHPEEFELTSEPKAGSIFSYYNHTGVILSIDEDGLMIVQDGNYNGVTDYNWDVATSDWATFEITLEEFIAKNPGVVFASPKNYEITIK